MAGLRFGCNELHGKTEAAALVPDADGYYYVCLGALNFYNSAGQYYSYEGSLPAFKEGSRFHRAIVNKNLFAERDHPAQGKLSLREYIARIRKVDPSNLCAHIREVEFKSIGKANGVGASVMAIYGWVKPAGPHKDELEAALKNKHQGVCWSVRSTISTRTHPTMGSTEIRDILECITFDWVLEGGISLANKLHIPALESLICNYGAEGIEVSDAILSQFVNEVNSTGAYALESSDVDELSDYLKSSSRSHGTVVKSASIESDWS